MGRQRYADASELTVTADCGGSNGARVRLWKLKLREFADETGLTIHVCHYPPGTSKWNKIEHRLFCHITKNWRATEPQARGPCVSAPDGEVVAEDARVNLAWEGAILLVPLGRTAEPHAFMDGVQHSPFERTEPVFPVLRAMFAKRASSIASKLLLDWAWTALRP